MTENLPVKKNDILQKMGEIEFYPILLDEQKPLGKHEIIPFTKLTTLGIGFEPIVSAFQSFSTAGGGSGIYYVNVSEGGHLAQTAGKYIGATLKDSNNQLLNQARLSPLVFNPTMLFMAAALGNIDKKLDKMIETQQEILNFLVEKDKAELRGNLIFLSDIQNNYKYNWNNQIYKNSNHVKVLDIRQSAEHKIIFIQGIIKDKLGKSEHLYFDREIKNQVEGMKSQLKEYQIALYSYAFSSYLEIMLLENFESAYLESVVDKINHYVEDYQELYEKSYNLLKEKSNKSIQSKFIKGLSEASNFIGKTVEKIPYLSDSQLDENLIKASQDINSFGSDHVNKTMQVLEENSEFVLSFVDNIKTVNLLYNKPMNILFDSDNLYLELSE